MPGTKCTPMGMGAKRSLGAESCWVLRFCMPKSPLMLAAIGILLLSLICQTQLLAATKPPASTCASDDQNIERWRAVRESAKDADANTLAVELAECLASRNPELRDRISYEVLTYWLRQDKLDAKTVEALRDKLVPWLSRGDGEAGTDDAIARAFSALILSELIRHDSIHHQWTSQDISSTLTATLNMFPKERDYRGLDSELGWIHCIAHAGDLLWRLALHPGTSGKQHAQILDALTTQINRLGLPPYTHNEGDRLARVVGAIAARDMLPEARLSEWITVLGQPGALETWGAAFSTPGGMAQLHNVKLFLRALRHEAHAKGDHVDLLEVIDTALRTLP